ncbi:MAG: NADPH:quinone reductase [Paracoccaceae bacterium]
MSEASFMHAAYYERTGDAAEVLQTGEFPVPAPGEGEVLVRIQMSGANPSDVKKRLGRMPAPVAYPVILPHSDGAGVVVAVGDGVDPARVGARVWLWNAQWGRANGTAASYCALPSVQAIDLPENVSLAEGACLGIPAQTAWTAVMEGRPAPGRTVLVHGGAGAVGEMAVAIAADAGARVIATVSTPEKAAIAQAAGASEVINYRTTDVAEAVLDLTGGADHIVDVDFGSNHAANARALAANGSIAAYSAPSSPVFEMDYYGFAAKAARLRFVQVYLLDDSDRRAAIAGITDLLKRDALPIRIARTFQLSDIIAAHQAQEAGVIGNIVIETGDIDADP